jgi:DNA-binding NarL/FixJ family response regulator
MRLTKRECELLVLIRRGASNREIAARLGLAEQTVKNYLVVLCEKLHVRNRTQLALRAPSALKAVEGRKKEA